MNPSRGPTSHNRLPSLTILLLTNLTGHPCVVLPDGFDKDGKPTSITFIGKLYDEATLLAFAKKFQDATNYNRKHPPIFK